MDIHLSSESRLLDVICFKWMDKKPFRNGEEAVKWQAWHENIPIESARENLHKLINSKHHRTFSALDYHVDKKNKTIVYHGPEDAVDFNEEDYAGK